MEKSNAQNLINPVENEYFEPKTQKGLENDQKSITFIDNFDMTFRHVEKPYKTNEKRGFSNAKNALRKPL